MDEPRELSGELPLMSPCSNVGLACRAEHVDRAMQLVWMPALCLVTDGIAQPGPQCELDSQWRAIRDG